MPNKVIILGGIGNGTVIADAIIDANRRGFSEIEFVGFLNDRFEKGEFIEKYPVLGNLNSVNEFIEKEHYFLNTIYRIDGQRERITLFDNLKIPETNLATFIHPTAYIAPTATIGFGSVVMPNVSISANAKIGSNCLIMPNATVGHNSELNSHCHLAAQSCISSFVIIDEGVHICLNACVLDNLKIGKYAALGMGSVLLKNIPENEIWAGNPAKFLRIAE